MGHIHVSSVTGRAVARAVVVIACIAAGAAPLRAQSDGTLELPLASLRDITMDFDAGRNGIYCYYGRLDAPSGEGAPVVHVDSVSSIITPSECRGLGFGFISRIDDRAFLINALRGLIETSPGFSVVSAFYRTDVVEAHGERVRSARALSVVRGAAAAAAAAARAGRSGVQQ